MALQTKKTSEESIDQDSRAHFRTAARRAYKDQKKHQIDNQQIAEMLPLVHKVVQRVIIYIKPPLSKEDLVSAGTLGLVRAARDYDPAHKVRFSTYAYIRIRGAILDELRKWSFVPPSVDKQIGRALQAGMEIAEQTGLQPTDTQLAEKLDIPLNKLYAIFENTRAKQFVSIDTAQPDDLPLTESLAEPNTNTPLDQAQKKELVAELAAAITQLEQKQRRIIILYYQQQLTMKQIAEVFEITEPRVSQLHASALFNLSLKLRQFKDGK